MTPENYTGISLNLMPNDVLHVVIDNPKHAWNVVDEDLHHDLALLFHELKRSDTAARAVLISARGKAFCAGGSFEWFETLRTPHRLFELNRHAKQLIWDMLDVELPIVAAVHGHAVGLGASVALLSDVIFMAKDAQLTDPHVLAGLVAGDGGAVAWPMALGPARAKEYLLTGDPVTATQAEQWGLVNHVVTSEDLLDTAMAFAARLAAGAPLAVRHTKLAVNKLVKNALNLAFDASTAYELTTFLSEDHKEAVSAFHEKRTARFTGN